MSMGPSSCNLLFRAFQKLLLMGESLRELIKEMAFRGGVCAELAEARGSSGTTQATLSVIEARRSPRPSLRQGVIVDDLT